MSPIGPMRPIPVIMRMVVPFPVRVIVRVVMPALRRPVRIHMQITKDRRGIMPEHFRQDMRRQPLR